MTATRDPSALWGPAAGAPPPRPLGGEERGPSESRARRGVLLAGALGTGLSFGLLWYELGERSDPQQLFTSFIVLSIAGGGVVGLAAGLADRVGLLLVWLAAATAGASIAVYLSVPQPEADETVGYAVLGLLFVVGGPVAVGCVLGWVLRRFRSGRAPWRAIGFAALVVVYVLLPEGPARDLGLVVLVVVGALLLKAAGLVTRALRRPHQQVPPG